MTLKYTLQLLLALASLAGACKFILFEAADLRFYRRAKWDFDVVNPDRDKSYRVNEFTDREPSNFARIVVIQPIVILFLLILPIFLWP